MTIEKERFEAWLFSQPRDRYFRFTNSRGCLICSFLNETMKGKWFVDAWDFGPIDKHGDYCYYHQLPKWLVEMVDKIRMSPGYHGYITISKAQDAFLAMFGEATDALTDSSATPTREGCNDSLAHKTKQ